MNINERTNTQGEEKEEDMIFKRFPTDMPSLLAHQVFWLEKSLKLHYGN